MGTVGMILRAAYNAEKIAIAAIALVLRLRWLNPERTFTVGTFFHCHVIFYTT
jgi:hypothetical protein